VAGKPKREWSAKKSVDSQFERPGSDWICSGSWSWTLPCTEEENSKIASGSEKNNFLKRFVSFYKRIFTNFNSFLRSFANKL